MLNLRKQFKKIVNIIITRDLLLSLIVVISLIIGGIFLGYTNNKVVPVNTSQVAHYTQEPKNKLSFMSNWDGPDYINIAKNGYSNTNNTNFYPLYPILIYSFSTFMHSFLYSALFISWIFLVGAVYYYLKIVKLLFKVHDNIEALKGVAFFMLFPTGVFLIATYTESLFAFFALGSIYYALKNKYFAAGILAFFANLTHVNGVFIILLITLILLEQKQKLTKVLAAAVVGSLGLVSYMYYLYIKFNNPLAFIDAQKKHGWLNHSISSLMSTIDWVNLLLIILIIVSAIYWWKRKKSFAVYSLIFLSIPIFGGQFGGFNRYVLMDFPLQLMLYSHFRNRHFGYALTITISAIIWTYFLFQYAGGYVGG